VDVVLRAVGLGVLVLLAGTLPRNALFVANLKQWPGVPWSAPLIAAYIALFWRYVGGWGPPVDTAASRRESLRAHPVSGQGWAWALAAGVLGIVALVFALRVMNRLVALPAQDASAFAGVPAHTVIPLLVLSAAVAGVVEEAAFRGYMQGPIERRYGLGVAILVTGTMFAVAHLDFTPILWPYYLAVAALYGTITTRCQSILPAVVLHTVGNLYSNFDLWLHGRSDWQAPANGSALVWTTGPDVAFWSACAGLLVAALATLWAFARFAAVSSSRRSASRSGA
jgi:membrane protease YdiL (CAAX protease family)